MLQKALSIAVIVAATFLAATPAEAFHCRGTYAYPLPMAANVNYAYLANLPCGYAYPCCVYGVKSRHHCLGHKIVAHCKAKRSWAWCGSSACGWGGCYSGCATGCYSGCYGSCGYDCCGCDSCGNGCGSACLGGCASGGGGYVAGEGYGGDAGTAGIPSDANIIYDRTVPESEPTEAITGEETSAGLGRKTNFRLASNSRRDGSGAFETGVAAFRNGSKSDALTSFDLAARAEPENALYQYYRALSLFEISGADAAQDALEQAVRLEAREAVPNWGKRMERVQGRSRLWIEKARREAGLTR
jgi:hypothetical protein